MATTRKSAPCPNCCPAPGMAYFEPTWDYDVGDYGEHPAIWRCLNCNYSTPRRIVAKKPRPADGTFASIDEAASVLNMAQVQEMRRLVARIAEYHSYGDAANYEFKRIEVAVRHGSVYLVTEHGMKNDEGTMASVLCRDYRHVAVGERGQLRLLNAKNKKLGKVIGLFRCANTTT